MADTGDVEVFGIGSIIGGRTLANRGWREPLRELSVAIKEARVGVASPLNMEVVFQVPGNILRPDFEGVRTGAYTKAKRYLRVQVALPEEPPDDPPGYLRVALIAAIDEAEAWACRRKVASDLSALRGIVASL